MNKFNTAKPWWTSRDGRRCKILAISEIDGSICFDRGKEGMRIANKDGTRSNHAYDLVTHLPDCTGWDWEPPKPIDVGEGYRPLKPGEPVDRSETSKDEYAIKQGVGHFAWRRVDLSLNELQCNQNHYVYRRPIEPIEVATSFVGEQRDSINPFWDTVCTNIESRQVEPLIEPIESYEVHCVWVTEPRMFRFASLKDATDEAERLCRKHNVDVRLLQLIDVCVPEAKWKKSKHEQPRETTS